MRKLRVIATILCIVMVGCVFPMSPVAAETPTYDTIGEILGFGVRVTQEYDLTTSDYGKTENTDAAVEQGVGLKMNGGRWRFGGSGSSSLGTEKAIYFRAKAEEGKNTYIYLHIPNPANNTASQAAYTIMLSENGIGTSDNNTHKQYCYEVAAEHLDFVPGTEFAEYLAVDKEDGTGLHIFARQDSLYDGKWVKTARFVGNFPSLSASSEFYMTTNGVLSQVTSYEAYSFSTIAEAMGKDVEKHQEFDFSVDTFSTNPEYIVSGGVAYSSAEGMSLGGGSWTYLPEANYLPIESGISSVTFSAKARNTTDALKISYADPNGGDVYGTIEISASAIQASGCENVLYQSGFVPGTEWVDYLLTANGDSVFLSTRNNGEWNPVLQTKGCIAPESTDPGLTFAGAGNVKESAIYGGIIEVVSPEEVAASKSVLWLDEDFSSPDEQWVFSNGAMVDEVNGVFTAGGQASSSGEYPFDDFDLGPNWRARFKLKVDSGDNATVFFAYGGQRFYMAIWPNCEANVSGGKANTISGIGLGTMNGVETVYGEWYEFFLDFTDENGTKKVSAYRRSANGGAWRTLWNNVTLNDTSGRTQLYFGGSATSNIAVDDLMVYEGNAVKLGEPVISQDTVSVTGRFDNADPNATKARQATVLVATYDKEHGYTTRVQEKKYVVYPGKAQDLNASFSLPGFDPEEENATAMLWNGVEDGVPLASSTGYLLEDDSENAPTEGQVPGIDAKGIYNEVILTGYVGVAKGIVTATLSKDGVVCAANQAVANHRGVIQVPIGIDPLRCSSGTYTLRIQYGDQIASESQVSLHCNDIIPAAGFSNAQELEGFIQTYGDDETKEAISAEGLLPYAYKYYQKIANSTVIDDVYEMRSCIEQSIQNANDEIALLAKVNQAVTQKNWYEIEKLMSVTYKDLLGYSAEKTAGVISTKDLFLRMTGGYSSAESLLADFEVAKAAQIAAESAGNVGGGNVGGGGFAGGASGGSFGGGSLSGGAVSVNPEALPDSMKTPVTEAQKPIEQFTDLESVPWAKESIEKLQGLGVVSGDGDGNFAPDRPVSREEFLKLIMEAAEIPVNEKAAVSFEDAKAEEWYYAYVATAYELGIIKGMSETRFGIGEQITRADMAVMLDRILKVCEITLREPSPTVIFDDWMKIPVYARGSVASLCAEELLNGVGDNRFAPLASATRAEAAVAVYRIYGFMNEGR